LKISLGSNAELETQLSLSRDLNYINGSKFKEVYELNEEVGRLLSSYISRLENSAWGIAYSA
jgi:four helix bundle protein